MKTRFEWKGKTYEIEYSEAQGGRDCHVYLPGGDDPDNPILLQIQWGKTGDAPWEATPMEEIKPHKATLVTAEETAADDEVKKTPIGMSDGGEISTEDSDIPEDFADE